MISILFLVACKPTPEEGIKYNDKIIAEQTAVMEKVNGLDRALKNYVPEEMDKAYNDLNSQLDLSIKNVQAMDKFDGKNNFKDVTVEYFKEIKAGLENEMKKVVELSKLPEDQYTEKEEKMVNELFQKNIDRTSKGQEKFEKFQRDFATQYKFKIEEKKSDKY